MSMKSVNVKLQLTDLPTGPLASFLVLPTVSQSLRLPQDGQRMAGQPMSFGKSQSSAVKEKAYLFR